jgi:hypothetical protein
MHRSGTSLVAEILAANGLATGRRRVGWSRHNPHGHFEDRFVLNVNKKLLRHFGGAWDDPPALPDGWLDDPYVGSLSNAAAAYGRSLIEAQGRFFFKDPRACLLLPFWRRAFGAMTHVVVLRSTESVVQSLLRRQSSWMSKQRFAWRWARDLYHRLQGAHEPIRPMDPARARWLVRKYHETMVDNLVGETVHLLFYEELLDEPARVVPALLSNLGQPRDQPDLAVVRPEFDHAQRRSVSPGAKQWLSRLREAECEVKPCRPSASDHGAGREYWTAHGS